MENILVVSGAEKGRAYFEDFLAACRYGGVVSAPDAASARALMSDRGFDLCIINAPLPDESGMELALETVKRGCGQSLIVVTAEAAPEARARVEPAGVFVITKPVKRDVLWFTLKSAAVVQNRINALQAQNDDLKRKIEDMRLISRAKGILIACLKMSEPQAHRFIEKQAMERRVTRAEIARRVINTYEE
ncbi:MAG: ANTAR domain-containing protein [Clostridiales Family XIII bacterium]|jgi:response regulator NasT|nr:ANTAR domain-containing protein [Clostridiales Family XIII bacterium]